MRKISLNIRHVILFLRTRIATDSPQSPTSTQVNSKPEKSPKNPPASNKVPKKSAVLDEDDDKESVMLDDELNIIKQVGKLKNILKKNESIPTKDKFNMLKEIMTMDFSLKSSEMKEIMRLDTIKCNGVHLQEVKQLQTEKHKLLLARNNVGSVYLIDYVGQWKVLDVADLVIDDIFDTTFKVKEENMLQLPDIQNKECITACTFARARDTTFIVMASTKEVIYLLKVTNSGTVELLDRKKGIKDVSFMISPPNSPSILIVTESNRVGMLCIEQIEGKETISIEQDIEEIDLDVVNGIKYDQAGGVFVWQFGNLNILNLRTGSSKPQHSKRSYELEPVLNELRPIMDVHAVGDTIWCFFADSTLTIVSKFLGGSWKPTKSFKLSGVNLVGTGISLNQLVLVSLSQPNLFDDSVEVSLYRVKKNDLEVSGAQMVANEAGSSESLEALYSALSGFRSFKGDYSDIFTLLLCTGKLEIIKNILDKALLPQDKSRSSVQQQDVFLEEVSKQLETPYNEVRTMLNRLLLNLYNRFNGPLDKIKKIKSKLARSTLKSIGTDQPLIKLLKNEQPIFECSQCKEKSLKVSFDTFIAECNLCTQKKTIFITDQGLEYILVRDLICRHCGVYHPLSHKQCILCQTQLVKMGMLASGC